MQPLQIVSEVREPIMDGDGSRREEALEIEAGDASDIGGFREGGAVLLKEGEGELLAHLLLG